MLEARRRTCVGYREEQAIFTRQRLVPDMHMTTLPDGRISTSVNA